MTIADAINRLQTNLSNSYSVCGEKGATLPSKQNFDNLPATISSITGGGDGMIYGIDINDILPNASPAITPSNHDVVIPAGAEVKGDCFRGLLKNSGIKSLTIEAEPSVNYQWANIAESTPFLESFSYTPSSLSTKHAFNHCCVNSAVKVANFLNLISADTYTFFNAFIGSGIETFNAEKLTSVPANCFQGTFIDAEKFKNFIIGNITSVGTSGFYSAFSGKCGILEVSFNSVSIGKYGFRYAFQDNTQTKKFTATIKSASSTYSFGNCFQGSHLDEVSIVGNTPLTVGDYTFYQAFADSFIKRIIIKNIGTLGTHAMQEMCNNVKTIEYLDIDDITSLNEYSMKLAFQNCDLSKANINNLFGKLSSIATVKQGYVDRGSTYQAFYNANLGDNIVVFSSLPETVNEYCFLVSTFEKATLKGISFETVKYVNTSGTCTDPFYFLCRLGKVSFVRFNVLEQIGSTTSTTSCYGFMQYAIDCYADVILPELKSIYSWSSTAQFGQTLNAKALYLPKLSLIGGSTPHYAFGKGNTAKNSGFEEAHFGIENQSAIESLGGYDSKFGLAVRTTIYFDLVNHITVDGIVYDRQGANIDCRNGYYSWNNGSSVIYTTNEWTPAIEDSVYTKSGGTYTVSGTITAVA